MGVSITAGQTTTNQTVVQLGTFDGPATGGWGLNRLVPLMNGTQLASVPLSGTQTIRLTTDSGDFDFLAFVPAAPSLRFNPPTISGGTVTISWTGTGTLQQATALTGNPLTDWSNVNPQPSGSSYQVTAGTSGNKFFRLKQ